LTVQSGGAFKLIGKEVELLNHPALPSRLSLSIGKVRFMKIFTATAIVAATLLLAQSCSISPNSQAPSTAVSTQQPQDSPAKHSKSAENHGEHKMQNTTSAGSHGGHKMQNTTTPATQAKLTVPETIAPNAPIPLAINIQDSTGQPIDRFDVTHEKLMHLIVVSDDLQFFAHLHPDYRDNGRFSVAATLPKAGEYTIFSDYKPTGRSTQVSTLKVQVPGSSSPATDVNFTRSQTVSNTNVNLQLPSQTVKAGEQVAVAFDLRDDKNRPVTDLRPYLGELGHLVIVRQQGSLTSADYIHAHAIKAKNPGQVNFTTNFPKPGLYKLWGQFDRNGEIVTADFWVKAN
jgi:hypothetical protein